MNSQATLGFLLLPPIPTDNSDLNKQRTNLNKWENKTLINHKTVNWTFSEPSADCLECFSNNTNLPSLHLILQVVVQRQGVELGSGEDGPRDERVHSFNRTKKCYHYELNMVWNVTH